eukprot:scaffold7641_cov85-Skeletonema_marinoi.AAC.1
MLVGVWKFRPMKEATRFQRMIIYTPIQEYVGANYSKSIVRYSGFSRLLITAAAFERLLSCGRHGNGEKSGRESTFLLAARSCTDSFVQTVVAPSYQNTPRLSN